MERVNGGLLSSRSLSAGVRCRVSGEAIAGWDCGDAAAAWFSQYLSEPHRLHYNPGIQLRAIDTKPHLYVNSANSDDKVARRYAALSVVLLRAFCLFQLSTNVRF